MTLSKRILYFMIYRIRVGISCVDFSIDSRIQIFEIFSFSVDGKSRKTLLRSQSKLLSLTYFGRCNEIIRFLGKWPREDGLRFGRFYNVFMASSYRKEAPCSYDRTSATGQSSGF